MGYSGGVCQGRKGKKKGRRRQDSNYQPLVEVITDYKNNAYPARPKACDIYESFALSSHTR